MEALDEMPTCPRRPWGSLAMSPVARSRRSVQRLHGRTAMSPYDELTARAEALLASRGTFLGETRNPLTPVAVELLAAVRALEAENARLATTRFNVDWPDGPAKAAELRNAYWTAIRGRMEAAETQVASLTTERDDAWRLLNDLSGALDRCPRDTEKEELLARLASREAALARATDLIRDFHNDDPCEQWDHHGYCQTHTWLTTDRPCPHARAANFLLSPESLQESQ